MNRTEIIQRHYLSSRLRNANAQFMPAKSTPSKYVYWSPSMNHWIAVEAARQTGWVSITYSTTCPCSG